MNLSVAGMETNLPIDAPLDDVKLQSLNIYYKKQQKESQYPKQKIYSQNIFSEAHNLWLRKQAVFYFEQGQRL